MAPKPGYQVPFDVSSDELVILQGDIAEATVVKAIFSNINGEKYKSETCELTLAEGDIAGKWGTFTITADPDNCELKGGKAGVVGYTEEIDTYTYLQFNDSPDDYWRLATFDEMYNTV